MKKVQFLLMGLIALSLSAFLFTSCEKDDDEPNKPYVGEWQSAIFFSLDLTTGAPVAQKMVFTFTNTTFEDNVYQGAVGATDLKWVTAMRGDIEATTTEMDVEITGISVVEGLFVDKASDPGTFDNIFNASLGKMLEEEFTADYTVDGDSMELSLPVSSGGQDIIQTLKLGKVK